MTMKAMTMKGRSGASTTNLPRRRCRMWQGHAARSSCGQRLVQGQQRHLRRAVGAVDTEAKPGGGADRGEAVLLRLQPFGVGLAHRLYAWDQCVAVVLHAAETDAALVRQSGLRRVENLQQISRHRDSGEAADQW